MPSFNKLLVANRGEIAARVIHTARALGYRTVAVYSDADARGRAVAMADEAVRIGPAPAAESYLDVKAILAAAARTGADAIHPGYGFLSENAEFAQACADAGIVFVGPPPAAIAAMGDKAEAKARMIAAGVPTVPGFQGPPEAQTPARLEQEAARIGYPVLLKATAGGGGRGMRRVDGPEQLAAAIESARSEAQNAFGKGDLLLEKLVEGARHVEIQVFADAHGAGIHLGERDCSAQRRHQKIIEESPCPVVDAALRARMGEAAVAAAQAIGYVGAGTVEFLLAAEGSFYFLEMNTRLQVEHPVTECVTGLDLVQWQLEVAAGGELPLIQDQVVLQGHAIEARLYAEDPAAGFMPQTGELLAWRPAEAEGLRVDHGLRVGVGAGQHVGSDYDPMVAKVIAHGATREQARRRLLLGLRDTALLGPRTNKRFLMDLLEHPAFVEGQVTTAFVESELETTGSLGRPRTAAAALVATAAMIWTETVREGGHGRPGFEPGWRSAHQGASVIELRFEDAGGEQLVRAELRPTGGGVGPVRWWVGLRRISDPPSDPEVGAEAGEGEALWIRAEHSLRSLEHDGLRLRVDVDGLQSSCVYAWTAAGELQLEHDGLRLRFAEHRPHEDMAQGSADGSDGVIRAPTMGKILSVDIAEGQRIGAGERLLVMEAMKIESTLLSPIAGTIRELRVGAGEQVDNNQVLVVIEPEPEPDPEVSE
ncbi:ATP-grasp domain-containing protein [Pseudenhygromyxa sp. WMMC2535]|uniref:acetyl/propionyl/methylcrotonyl-CoA carboxylase subunit alpha n=1 Tax=Pseudenhygromyxa sp. WMMC2535 TaxID=2712867 RepID=UPI0015551F14|nr:biotin carboxylase N-terminal domain-containing protein [Pseudenhygromyxa sp. WMMC2535]NVB36961.1 ATP-grasp domain-containing protein [Pseudenhygromyxa sp. WMMC2535]